MRTSQAALAIITRINSLGNPEYLTQWNNGWNAYSLIGGHVEEGETFQQCCIREIEEELECGREEIDVDDVPVCTLRFRELSKAAGVETDYEWQIFVARIADDRLGGLPAACAWVDAQQARQKVTKDGQPVADQVWRVVSAVEESNDSNATASATHAGKLRPGFSGQVTWMADARRDLSEELCRRLGEELLAAFSSHSVSGTASAAGVDASRDGVEPLKGQVPATECRGNSVGITNAGIQIVVKQRFKGFSDEPLKKIILAVEVQTEVGVHSGVVKMGIASEVGEDYTGWKSCAESRGVNSRMFIAPRRRELGNPPRSRVRQNSDASGSSQTPNSHESSGLPDPAVQPQKRVAIIYPDVYQYYFDNGRDDEPKELESIVEQSILRNVPTYSSVERVITQVFTEAFRCFYRHAQEDTTFQSVLTGVSRSLRIGGADPVFERWQQPEYLKLRRGAAWLTCGKRQPDSTARPEYIDPVDYLRWVLARRDNNRSRVRQNSDLLHSTRVPNSDESGYKSELLNSDEFGDGMTLLASRIPSTLIGPAHGDLHGRNIIVGVVRGEAEWPAVFDFDNMRPTNIVALDFAKLELELKCRLLPQLLESPASCRELRRLLQLPDLPPMPSSITLSADDVRVQQRAERMRIMFAIEQLLNAWSISISSRGMAIRPDVEFEPAVSPETALGRALRIIFRIRREAAMALGYERQGRESRWRDEYNFALAVYGVTTAKWHSASDHLAWCLLSAGVAAANLSQWSWPVDPKVNPAAECNPASGGRQSPDPASSDSSTFDFSNIATYLQLLPWAHTCWKNDKAAEPIPLLRAAIERFPYAVALRQQLALSLAQSSEIADEEAARREIESLANLACVFRDHETLCRLGRIYKDRADRLLDSECTHAEMIEGKLPSYQHYLAALKHYRTAFEFSNDYYPGVNAATLALLVGNHDLKTQLATKVLDICGQFPLDRPDQTWILATEGEASLLLGHTDRAVNFYRGALDRILPTETGVIRSMRDQLLRLQWALGHDPVEAVIQMMRDKGRLQ